MSTSQKLQRTFLYGFVATGFMLSPAVAQTASTATVTSLVTTSTTASSTNQTVSGAGTGTYPSATNYDIIYLGETTSITSFTTGTGVSAVTYNPLNYGGSITTSLVRLSGNSTTNPGGANQNNNLVYHRMTVNSGISRTVVGPYNPSQESLFNSNNLNAGTDNLFGNQGDGSGNNNNVERLDVVFSNGLVATDSLAFLVLERGGVTAHDGFGISAILSVDGLGNPTAFGSVILFGSGSYGTTALVPDTTDWLILRNLAAAPNGDASHPSADSSNQPIGGTTVAVTASTANRGLGITAATTIYGYSLFGFDVTATTSAELLDVANNILFPKNTPSNTGAGGIDLIAYTGIAVNAVPEPGTVGLLGMAAFVGMLLRSRKRSRR